MSLKYKIFEDIKLVYVKAVDLLDYDELMDHIEKLANDPAYIPPMKKLLDYVDLKKSSLTNSESIAFSKRKQELSDRFLDEKCAIVTQEDYFSLITKYHQSYIDEEKLKTRIFQNIDEAKVWLDIDLLYELSI
jgi:hypothetical protein